MNRFRLNSIDIQKKKATIPTPVPVVKKGYKRY
jgi:hypothetical protein